jgi:hypothetical protein
MPGAWPPYYWCRSWWPTSSPSPRTCRPGRPRVGLLAGVDSRWLAAPLGAALAELLLASRYGQVAAVLRHLMLGFAAFGVAVLAHPDWPRLLTASLVPGAAGSWSA